MSRKDYELIARTIADQRAAYAPHWDANLFRALDDTARRMAHAFEMNNVKFDSVRFLAACGVK